MSRDQDARRTRPARLPRSERRSRARLRERRLCRDHEGRRFARGFRGNPPDGHEDVAQLLQHEPADQNERIASRRLTQHSAPRGRAWRRTAQKRGARKNMADLGIQQINPNKALWEKGDFTRIAETMRESGEDLVATLGVEPGMKVLDLGCGDGTTAIPSARSGADVLGVDIASNLVAAGNERAKAVGLDNLRFQEGDASNLSNLADESFDLVVSIFGAMFAPR